MPRAFDRGQPTLDKDPNRFGTDFQDPMGAIVEGALDVGTQIRNGLVGVINDLTGINLESVTTLIESIGGAFETLIDWLTDLVDLDGFLAALEDLGTYFTGLLDRTGFLTALDDVMAFFTGLLDRAGFLDVLQDVIGFFAGLLNPTSFLGVMEDVVDFFTGLADRSGFLTVLEDVVEFFTGLLDRSGFLSILEDVVGFFGTITTWSTWSTALKTLIDGLLSITSLSTWTTLLKQVIDFFGTITSFSTWSGVLKQVIDFFATIASGVRGTWLNLLNDVVNFFGSLTSFSGWTTALKTFIDGLLGITNFSTWVGVLKQVTDFFATIASNIRGTWLTLLNDVVTFFGSLTSFSGWTTALKTFIDGLLGITSFSTWVAVFKQVVDFFTGITAGVRGNFLTVYKQVIDAFVGLGNSTVIGTFLTVFTQVINFFGTITAGARGAFLTAIQTVTEFFQGVISSFGSLPNWLARIPSLGVALVGELWSLLNGGAEAVGKTINDVLTSVGDFAAGLIQNITGTPGALGLGDVGTWARNLLDKGLTWPDLKTLFGDIPASILGVLPIPNISLVNPELMSQGGFDTSTTLAPGSGWAWDSATQSGSSGSAKVTGAGTARQLYSNQSIEVAQGDKLLVSCWVKSTGTVGAGGIVLSIVEFNGTTQGTTRTIASRASSTPWVQIGDTTTSTYTVGAGVTSIRVRLAVTSAAASGSAVWFDNISVKKTGLLDGSWMEGLLGTVVDDFQTIADSIAQAIKSVGTAGTGNALTTVLTNIQSIFSRLFGIVSLPASLIVNPLLEAAIPGLSGSKITSGEVNVDWLPITDIADEIGTTPVTGSGGKMSRRNTATKITAAAGNAKFGSSFYVTSGGSSGVEQISSDITASHVNGRYTVTYAGYYLVEVGFTTNASTPAAGYFNVAPAVYRNGSTTPYKVGADALGSFGGGFGNYSRSAHSTFIVYLGAGGYVEAGYVNFGASNGSFFEGDSAGNSTYFGIAMLNRTAEG